MPRRQHDSPRSRSRTSRATIRTSSITSSAGDADVARRRATLHPAFHGSYDWHSCVHMHWLLARLRGVSGLPAARGDRRACFDRHFSADAIAAEVAYLARPASAHVRATYGWAWLLKLAAELARDDDRGRARWSRRAAAARRRVRRALSSISCRARTTRSATACIANSAFALALALDYARVVPMTDSLERMPSRKALAWFGGDRDAAGAHGSRPAPISCRPR